MRTHRTIPESEPTTRIDGGFTLVEVLIVMVVLGVLAAIVVFMLHGAPERATRSACAADAKTVNLAATVYLTRNPDVTQVTEAQLVAQGTGTLASWPTSAQSAYQIVIAGDGNALVGSTDADGVSIAANNVLVKVGSQYYDATKALPAACDSA